MTGPRRLHIKHRIADAIDKRKKHKSLAE